MLTESLYVPRGSVSLREVEVDKLPLCQILVMKLAVIIVLMALP